MDKQYNLYNLEPSFRNFLAAENISSLTIKNYSSDLRHFFGWITFKLNVKYQMSNIKCNLDIVSLIDSLLIGEYKSYLVENNLPLKTINRRLSTLRKFCSFCILQGWMKTNPAKQIQNVKVKSQNYKLKVKSESILKQFNESLLKEGLNSSDSINHLKDIEEFLSLSGFTFNF